MTERQTAKFLVVYLIALVIALVIGLFLASVVGAQEAHSFYLPMVEMRTISVKLSPAPGSYPLGYPDISAVVRMPNGERCYSANITWSEVYETRFSEYHTDCVLTASGWVALPWVSLYQAAQITGLNIRIVTDAGVGIVQVPGVWEFGK